MSTPVERLSSQPSSSTAASLLTARGLEVPLLDFALVVGVVVPAPGDAGTRWRLSFRLSTSKTLAAPRVHACRSESPTRPFPSCARVRLYRSVRAFITPWISRSLALAIWDKKMLLDGGHWAVTEQRGPKTKRNKSRRVNHHKKQAARTGACQAVVGSQVGWGALGCSGVLWGALGCSGVLWGALGPLGRVPTGPKRK